MYQLRPYQADSVKAVVHYFRKRSEPAVIVLPTGAGKSLVIAELARLAKGKVLVMAHVKELVEQNHAKYESYDLTGAIFAAGLGRKETEQQVVFASVQSVARNLDAFNDPFSLLVIDECHRVPEDKNSSYQKVISHLKALNPNLKILGLTATPYRLGLGWIYQYHTRGQVRSDEARFFRDCVFELPIRYLLDQEFLTPAKIIDAPLFSYDFSEISPTHMGRYRESDMDLVIEKSKRATPQILNQIVTLAKNRKGIMIFAATVKHAQEVYELLPEGEAAIVIGNTHTKERDRIIDEFKQQKIKYLVNVSVLTTGFDAPHVDLIAVLRPTESISLYQQIIGRGLRLSEGKSECLVLEYAGNCYDLYQPEVGAPQPDPDSEIVTIPCPACGFNNNFWGKTAENGFVIEHYGRKCQGYLEDDDGEREHCDYRFRAKYCRECGADNDIAARICHECDAVLVDPDKKLKEALSLKDALVYECTDLEFSVIKDSKGKNFLRVVYLGESGNKVGLNFYLNTPAQKKSFYSQFVKLHLADKHQEFDGLSPTKVVNQQHRFRLPKFVIARKEGRFWKLRDVIFDNEFML
ncbi:ATP-dependent helicase [Vibrio breoganii]|uniref:DEAD/DEAH box helicase n=1 Tax=Vibrio breoganii TaxID=553239 RepID=UPI000C83AED3|nr:DEAD/DEAH box helicase [Vibrio breoganii]PMO60822.1 ATP-dependent helicase [Vibrio breoganii]